MATQPEIEGDLVPASSEQHTPISLADSSSSICRPNPKIERALYRAIRGQIDGIFQSLSIRKHEYQAKFKIEASLKQLEDLEIDEHVHGTEEKEEENRLITIPQIRPELRKLMKFVMKYKRFLPCFEDLDSDWVDNDDDIDYNLAIPSLPENPAAIEDSKEFPLIEATYYALEWQLQLCLLCFSVFPEDTIIKKRVMLYWWIGEGFVYETFEQTAEEFADECFDQLIEKGLIEPIYRLHNMAVDGCKVPHFVRSAVITFAQRDNFFHFDSISAGGRNPAAVMPQDYSDFTRACLLGKAGLSKSIQNLQILRTLFNLNQCLLEVGREWISNMTNIQILYLGRWQLASTFHHIEVQGTDADFLNRWLENASYLSFLSLQGIYGITELPAVALSKMLCLEILDLRDCYSLELLPDTISELKNLTHLDMSECYLLDHMPKGISLLLKLQVLKGFVIGGSKRKDSCNLDDLAGLKEMRKLNIRAVKNGFPTDKELNALQNFRALRKLKIEWEEGSSKESTRKLNSTLSKLSSKLHDSKPNTIISKLPSKLHDSKPNTTISKLLSKLHDSKQKNKSISLVQALPAQLEKLDLHCFPQITPPKWLMPSKLKNLKKLYIRGGQLRLLYHIDQEFDDEGNVPESDEWAIEILRLKYLAELEMDWRVLHKLFPKLICSETVECPKLSFPCDEKGLWKAEQLN